MAEIRSAEGFTTDRPVPTGSPVLFCPFCGRAGVLGSPVKLAGVRSPVEAPRCSGCYRVFAVVLIGSGSGSCPGCGCDTGRTPTGSPRVGRCGRCKMRAWRAANPEKAAAQTAGAMKRRRRKLKRK